MIIIIASCITREKLLFSILICKSVDYYIISTEDIFEKVIMRR
ncbi:hypothetical protein CLP_3505 [Clostridium butyricum E4 str. BoNT E BL5262]|uniref:Uncharacterized protein n=1 Tax=Clostridium butyricum E4 str. BoNT E BL5262 TaxID=632245 RepID=C4IDS5_CLOBU|nr:hypothetical protein CLP_3505 [Clostridium butyricum E4 str. BoNT E BL5262]